MSILNLEPRPIKALLEKKFFIPAYQRGYRWTPQQVEDLLNDISEFRPKQIDKLEEETWYCLQPLVLRNCDPTLIHKNMLPVGKWYEVIDGQQRLTTIFLILHYLNDGRAEKRKKPLFDLRYETRAESETFLKTKLHETAIDDSNIDFYHISNAYASISKWFKEKTDSVDEGKFESKLLSNTKVIWYESFEKDPIAIFTRLNMGKIPLTSAELIKALFLNSSNFKGDDSEKIRLKQLEIAQEWDRIEYTLQNKEFWYFLNRGENVSTRIEFILNLIAGKPSNCEDKDWTFRHFYSKFSKKSLEEVNKNWGEIKAYFQILEEWFSDGILYHKIGFLIEMNEPIIALVHASKGCTKSEFQEKITDKIKEKVNVQINDLEYGKGPIKTILLLHNIQTMLNDQKESRFSFFHYKNKKWDIEHIHAVADEKEMPKTEIDQATWFKEVAPFITDKTLNDRLNGYKKGDDFQVLYKDILDDLSEKRKHEDIHSISNLALLDSGTNRGYKNAVFPVKRKEILKKDKTATFIPPCTKNVFMKAYTESISQMNYWGELDRNAYLEDIKNVLKPYLPKQKNG